MTVSASDFPIGYANFEELIKDRKIYIDKTSYLADLVKGDKVTLLLRPRRFGKTLSMSMLAAFLEMNYQNPDDRSRQEKLFNGLNVYKNNQELCRDHMGRYPVINISLKDVDGQTEIDAMNALLNIMSSLFKKFRFLRDCRRLDPTTKTEFMECLEFCQRKNRELAKPENKETAKNVISTSLSFLMSTLVEEYGRPVAVIVDEYDVPLQKAAVNGYYPEMLELVRSIMSSTFKDNTNLFKGYVTGCLRISHQSIFTGANNFSTFGQQNEAYSGFIGLAMEETRQLFRRCGLESRFQEAVDWYDGYNFADNDMLCPWSVMSFLRDVLKSREPSSFKPQNYWANTSGNDILEICMKHPDETDTMRLQNLMEGKPQEITLREFTSYPKITGKTSFDVFGTLMLHTGYFTKVRDGDSGERDCEKGMERESASSDTSRILIKIPNREVRQCFADKADELFSAENDEWRSQALDMRDAFLAGDVQKAEDIVNGMLKFFISLKDSAYESFYHGFLGGVLGMTVTGDIKILSNRESGDGYADLIVKDNRALTVAILELKKSDDDEPMTMKRACRQALKQIDDTNYDRDFKDTYRIIHKYGLAFHSKKCRIAKEQSQAAL